MSRKSNKYFNNIAFWTILVVFQLQMILFAEIGLNLEDKKHSSHNFETEKGDSLFSPSIIDQASEVSSLTPIFKWNKIANANGYTIYLNEIVDGIETETFNSSYFGIISNPEFSFPKGIIENNKKYSLTMRAFNSFGWSDYSKPYIFVVQLENDLNKLNYPNVITKNYLQTLSEKDIEKSLIIWEKVPDAENYDIYFDGINSSSIFGEEYLRFTEENLKDKTYIINRKEFSKFDEYRWQIKSINQIGESNFSPFYYFKFNDNSKSISDSESEEIILRLKYGGIIDEMIIAKLNDNIVLLPLIELFSILQLNHNFDMKAEIFSGEMHNSSKLKFHFDIKRNTIVIGDSSIVVPTKSIIQSDLDYFISKSILENLTGMKVEIDMRNLVVNLSAEFMLPMIQRMINEKNLNLTKDSQIENTYPLLFNRNRNYLSGGFLDYSATANYLLNQSPYYSLNFGLGAEVFGGDVQLSSQQTLIKNELTYSELRYKWRYAFLNNDYISNISIGHNNTMGLQSYNFKGLQISNEPVEARRIYGRYSINEKTKPLWKIEVYHNNQLIEIVQADEKGNYSFLIPFSYGTTLLDLHQIGPHGELEIESKIYQIPVEQVPKGRLDYSVNFGEITNTKDYIFQSSAAYGINNWLTTGIGTDLFTNDFNSSSIYSNTTARFLDGYLINLTLAPNAFHEVRVNSIFSNLTSFTIGAKLYEANQKLNPTNIKSEFEGNLFLPIKFDQNILSIFLRGRHSKYDKSTRTDLSLRTFYNYRNLSPSVELDYYNLNNGVNDFQSVYLNFRLNYSLYIPSPIFSGNIIDTRFVYDLMNSESQSINISLSTTVFHKFRVQLSHTSNFNNSYSDTQLRVVFDLPFFRSSTTASRNLTSQSFNGSINYNQHLEEFNFYNRGMIGRSAATFKFFVDKNMNNHFDEGEDLVPNMDIQINSIGNKNRVDEGNVIVNDLESYSKYDVKLVDRYNKNPLWFPYKDKFSFISDPHQYKEIEIPFYEAAEVFGSVLKKVQNNLTPISGANIILEDIATNKIVKIKSMSDGTFYHYGINPGNYRIYLDEEQMNRLKLIPSPKNYNTIIQSIKMEEKFAEYNFILE